MFKVEVIADASNKWTGNGLEFDTYEKAARYGLDLSLRWLAVRDWRVVDLSTGEVVQARSVEANS